MDSIIEFFMTLIFFSFAPLVFFTSFICIPLPAHAQFGKEHFKNCLLKHKSLRDRWYHFWDTRGGVLTFNHHGIKPSKRSPNYHGYLLREKHFLQEQIENHGSWPPGYRDYCTEELKKINHTLDTI